MKHLPAHSKFSVMPCFFFLCEINLFWHETHLNVHNLTTGQENSVPAFRERQVSAGYCISKKIYVVPRHKWQHLRAFSPLCPY